MPLLLLFWLVIPVGNLLLQLFFWFVIPAGNLLLLLLLQLQLLLFLPLLFWFVIPRRSRANLLPPVLRSRRPDTRVQEPRRVAPHSAKRKP